VDGDDRFIPTVLFPRARHGGPRRRDRRLSGSFLRQPTTRRQMMIAAGTTGAMLMNPAAIAATNDPIVETRQGKLRGTRAGQSYVFRGVRYAVADRFMPPRQPAPWAGIRDALEFGASAPQTNASPPPGPPYVITAQLPRPEGAPPPVKLPESEDCLFLNVWTPALNDGRKRPVMVWLHGGFFYGGSGSTVDGSRIAGRGDAVVVSVNHRLNAFGYTHLGDILGGDFAASGNAGMLDIVAALEWVRDNIEAFGGDPARVMAFGTSGGGMKTSFLMASPRAEGLIHRAGVQSGPGLRFMERDAASAVSERLLAELGLGTANARDLATVPMDRLLAGYHAVAASMKPRRFIDLPSFSPVIDPLLLPRHPFSPDAAPQTRTIPMLIGWNAQEMSFFWGNDPDAFNLDEAGLATRAAEMLGGSSPPIVAAYADAYPHATPARRYLQLASDYALMLPVTAQAERHAAGSGVGTYLYRLDHQSPALGGKLGALHTMEGPLLFDTVDAARPLLGPGAGPEVLARRMSEAWVRFAQTGAPNGAGPPTWPAYDAATRATMLFDVETRVANDPSAGLREMLRPTLGI
jgi:para-nitrobenzyl esterase